MRCSIALVFVLSILCTSAAYGQSEVQRQHDADIKLQSDALTRYHNNADDYPKDRALPITRPAAPSPSPAAPVSRPLTEADKAWIATREAWAAGDADAAYRVAQEQYTGGADGPGWANKPKAFEIWYSVADRNPAARFEAGRMLSLGEGVPADYDRGMAMMQSASAAGNVYATNYLKALPPRKTATLGEFPSMLTRARDEFEESERPSAARAKYILKQTSTHPKTPTDTDFFFRGLASMLGLGVPVDLAKARELLLQAQALQNPAYSTVFEELLWLDFLELDKNPEAYKQLALSRAGPEPSGMLAYHLAIVACLDHNPAKQRFYLEQAAAPVLAGKSSWPTEAIVDLGLMQLTGEGGPVDEAKGFQNLLAARSNRQAQFYISQLLATGAHGVPKEPGNARAWLELAAKAGQPDAIRELARSSGAAEARPQE